MLDSTDPHCKRLQLTKSAAKRLKASWNASSSHALLPVVPKRRVIRARFVGLAWEGNPTD